MANDWEWYGQAAHLIVGQWCRFHLATKVGKYLVSTVGEYVHPRHSQGSEMEEAKWLKKNWPGEEIGYGRKYETMVFIAGEPCTLEGCNCGLPSIAGSELDMAGYNTAGDARRGHFDMCSKWAEMDGVSNDRPSIPLPLEQLG